ncbi:DNA internalization-related competence protein ComEC/Rec2 [Lysinibacillus sp. 54212]|uniref:DNA internalization-related competence protein ComEC/Rec2 n=1 Tax=Lysinibacillus sp. 54212 TaxID=3119829 RepID=UPI002FCB1F2B
MNYLVDLLKHKWIFYALSILVALFAAHESIRLLFLLALLGFGCFYKRFSVWQIATIIGAGVIAFGYFSWQLSKLEKPLQLPASLTFTDTYKINGQTLRGFMQDQDGRNNYIVYTFRSEEEKTAYEAMPLAGITFTVEGELEPPDRPPHAYSFSMENYLKSKSAIGIVNVSTWEPAGQQGKLLQAIYKQRFKLKQHIEESFPPSLSAEAQALLIGVQENVDEELNRAYQKLGITHLFAISGLHVALVSLLFFQGLLRLRVRRELATIILILILPIYALLAGGAPSVWRAVSVVEFVLLAKYFNWRLPIEDALAISFIGFVLLEPGAVYQVGFQLSYLATLSLIYSAPILARMKTWWMQGFMITFVCQLLVYPILLFHFYELSLSSLLANIVFVPLFSFVILPVNFVLLLATFIPGPLANLLFIGYEPLRTGVTDFILYVQGLPYQMWVPGKPSRLWMITLYVSVFTAFLWLDMRRAIWKIACVILIPALLFQASHYTERALTITFVDVGQGDCIVIELPHRRGVYMIDSGGLLRFEQEKWKRRDGQYEVGKRVVVPFLKGKGISELDMMILTHADADHVEGAEEILREIRVDTIHVTPASSTKDVMKDILTEASKQKIQLKEQMAGDGWQQGDASFHYLWPTETDYEGNNDSLVLLLQFGSFQALFTGDLEAEGEKRLIQEGRLHQVYLLKAGHHGSKTSSTEAFVDTVQPALSVFMAGKDNRYGHPHAEVVERFDERGLPYLTTGEVGTIEVKVAKGRMTVHTVK